MDRIQSADDDRFVVHNEGLQGHEERRREHKPYGFGIDDVDENQIAVEDDINSFTIVPHERSAKSDIPWLVYHNIHEDVPESKRINAEWALLAYATTSALALMNICISVMNIVDIGGGLFNLARGLAMLELISSTMLFFAYLFVGFFVLYWQMYNAFRTSNSLRYLFAFVAQMINIGFCCVMALGIPAVNPGLFSAVVMAVGGAKWFTLFMQFMTGIVWVVGCIFHGFVLYFMLRKMRREERSLRKGLQQLREWSGQWRDRYTLKQAFIGSYA